MPTFTVPSDTHNSDHNGTWTQPPTLIFTLSDSDSDSSAYIKPAPEHGSGSVTGFGDTGTDGPIIGPRGHRLAWTIPSRIVQPPSIPAFSQISLSLSTLSFTRSSRPKTPLLSSSPTTPTALSCPETKSDQLQVQNSSTPSSHFLRAPPLSPTDVACDRDNNKDDNLTSRIRINTVSTASAPPPAPRRSAFTTTTTALFTPMSRPSWDPFPLLGSTSSHSHSYPHTHSSTPTSISTGPSTNTAPVPILSNPNPISIEDARLLDPSYLSSIPIPSHVSGVKAYSHTIPYVDPQGMLHDPDYRPFPLIRQTKHPTRSPFAIRKPYWETDDDEFNSLGDDDDGDGSTPNTPTSITPFICYFLETHPLKRGTPLRNHNNRPSPSSRFFGSSYTSDDDGRSGRGKRGKGPGLHNTRSQLKLGTAYMYATIATGLGKDRSQGYAHSPTTPTYTTNTTPIPQYTNTLSTSPPTMEELHHGKEKKGGWGGLLWKSNRKEGGDRD